MKKTIALLLSLVLLFGTVTLAACSKKEPSRPAENSSNLKIVTTIFPIYDWVKNLTAGNEHADITMLLDSGADLHNYQPSAEDIIKVSDCDLFLYIGGESDKWAEDALKNKSNNNMVVINLMEALGDSAKEEEIAEGMQAEEEAEEEGEEAPEYDEHIWLSLKNAEILVSKIADGLSKADSANSALYTENAKAYLEKLAAIDTSYQAAADAAAVKTLVFGDRFPFRYLVDDYGLHYYAAFIGCSAETEASFETISFLAQKVDELGLHYVLTLEGTDHKIAETVIQNTAGKNQTVLSLNSMQSITADDLQAGADYLDIMQNNLTVFTQALKN